jgi:hypothetical protein
MFKRFVMRQIGAFPFAQTRAIFLAFAGLARMARLCVNFLVVSLVKLFRFFFVYVMVFVLFVELFFFTFLFGSFFRFFFIEVRPTRQRVGIRARLCLLVLGFHQSR